MRLSQGLFAWYTILTYAVTTPIYSARASVLPAYFPDGSETSRRPIIIGHRGGYNDVPEHTLAAYELGIREGADFIEPDVLITKDGILVVAHDVELSSTTNVATIDDFKDRYKTIDIPGSGYISGFFIQDFTLDELRTLRLKQRVSGRSTFFDGMYQVATLEEVIQFVHNRSKELERPIGLYPEMKHPMFFLGLFYGTIIGQPRMTQNYLEEFARVINNSGFDPSWLFIQCFDPSALVALSEKTPYRMIQLVGGGLSRRPDTNELFRDMILTEEGRRSVKTYAAGVGVAREYISRNEEFGDWISEAHRRHLLVHAWTYSRDVLELTRAFDNGVDGVFADFVSVARGARFAYAISLEKDGVLLDITTQWRTFINNFLFAIIGTAGALAFFAIVFALFYQADQGKTKKCPESYDPLSVSKHSQ